MEKDNNKRKKLRDNQELLLRLEVDSVCPLCTNILHYIKKNRAYKYFEIAHIYPLNPTPIEAAILKDAERLTQDPNHPNNLICLCIGCHQKFDRPRTLEEYNELLRIKKHAIQLTEEKKLWSNSKIDQEIEDIIEFLASTTFKEEEDNIEYNPKTIDEKTNSTMSPLTKRKIHLIVQEYFNKVRRKFIELDNLKPGTTEIISTQIKSHYLILKRANESKNQKEIFDGMMQWLDKITNNKSKESKESAEIIVSYFIQNCEIFE